MVIDDELVGNSTPSTVDTSSGSVVLRNVGVFWDYENLPLPSGTNVPRACQAITKTIARFGQIRDQRLYFDFGDNVPQYSTNPSWSALDSVFDLVNTPKRSHRSKETLDKKLISDVWAYAWDTLFRSSTAQCSIVLISSDGDYAHTLNKLRNRGVHCIVVHGAIESVSSMLQASADLALSLRDDILLPHDVAPRTGQRTSVIISEQPKVVEPTAAPSSTRTTNEPLPINASETTHTNERTTTKNDHNAMKGSNEVVRGKRNINRVITLCKILQKLSHGNDGASWVSGGRVPPRFAAETGILDANERTQCFRSARELAKQLGWIEHGYRLLGLDELSGKVIATRLTIDSNPLFQEATLGEDCLRLTMRGRIVATSDFAPPALKTTCLFIKNISVKSSLQYLVQCLESHVGVRVVLAQVKPTPYSSFWLARVKVFNDAEAKALLQSSSITLYERTLEVFRDDYYSSILDCLSDVGCGDPPCPPTTPNSKSIVSVDSSHLPDVLFQTPGALNAVPSQDDATLLYDICIDHCDPDNWIDGAKIGTLFKASLGTKQSTKQRFRKAYRDAWNRGTIEVGRKRTEQQRQANYRLVDSSRKKPTYAEALTAPSPQRRQPHQPAIAVDTVSPDDRLTGYEPGLYFRVSSSSWHGREKATDNDDLARAEDSPTAIEHDDDVAQEEIETPVERGFVDEHTVRATTVPDREQAIIIHRTTEAPNIISPSFRQTPRLTSFLRRSMLS